MSNEYTTANNFEKNLEKDSLRSKEGTSKMKWSEGLEIENKLQWIDK